MDFVFSKADTTASDDGRHYAIVYDHNAGRPDRYTVLVWDLGIYKNGNLARVIGRELPLGLARDIVRKHMKGKNK